jgi:Flp pilus assembly protein TadD
MRRSSRRQKRELYCLTRFLESFFGNDLLEFAKNRMNKNIENINHITLNLALADALRGSKLSDQLKKKSYDALMEWSETDNLVLNDFELPQEFISAKTGDLITKAYNLEIEKKYIEAESAYKKAIEIDEKNARPWNGLGNLYQNHLGKFAEAEAAYKKAIEIDEKFAFPWNGLGSLYFIHVGKYSEAESAYNKAIALNEKYASSWHGLGSLFHYQLGKYAEAEVAYRKAIEIDEKFAHPWNDLGYLFQNHFAKYTEAEAAFKKAIEIDEKFAPAWNGLGNLFQLYLGKFAEAEAAYKKAIEIDNKYASPWNGLGYLYQSHLGKYVEAEVCYKKAISLDNTFIQPKHNLFILWRDKMNELDKAKALFDTFEVSEEAKDSYYLNKALFSFYEKNIGIAEDFLKKAINHLDKCLLPFLNSDWYQSAAIIIKLGYGTNLLTILSSNGHDIILRPFYVAIEALTKKEEDLFLNSIAAEVREPAKKIMEMMKKYTGSPT